MKNLKSLEKLLFLLQKFEKERGNKKHVLWEIIEWKLECTVNVGWDENLIDFPELLIPSKEYKFIEWLIENDEITDDYKATRWFDGADVVFKGGILIFPNVNSSLYDSIICWLALSEDPIKDLVRILR